MLRRDPQADRWHFDYIADLPDGRTLYVRDIGAGLYAGSTLPDACWTTAAYLADRPGKVLDWFLAECPMVFDTLPRRWEQGEEG
jgi:hypothetical protein